MTNKVTSTQSATPLCVDLDGTLIQSDLLHEAVFKLLRSNILYMFLLPVWWWNGKANLKSKIASRVAPDVTNLPYREQLILWLKQQKSEGRKLVLATVSHESYANSVAAHLGIFDNVRASSTDKNLSGSEKARLLVEEFGEKGFDYIGNSSADVPVWDVSRKAITVGNEKAALDYSRKENAERFSTGSAEPSPLKTWAKALRVHQWVKNTLLFVPTILAFNYITWGVVADLIIAFFSFSFCASSVYLLNDLTDIEVDRRHKTKRNRPIPAGVLPIQQAAIASVALLFAAFILSFALPWLFTLILALYYLTTCGYSFIFKRMLLIDVLTLSSLFTIRVLAGATAVSGSVSTWLLAFSMFFFLSLALVKRFVEVGNQLSGVGPAETGRGYQVIDLETLGQAGVASGFAAVVVLALFIDSPQIVKNYSNPEVIWLVCPLVLYLVLRIWILARRGEMHDDPVVFLMTDWRSQLMVCSGALLMLISQLV